MPAPSLFRVKAEPVSRQRDPWHRQGTVRGSPEAVTVRRVAWLEDLVRSGVFARKGYLLRDIWDPFERRMHRSEDDRRKWYSGQHYDTKTVPETARRK